MINKKAKKDYDEFDVVPQRTYSDFELSDFHKKVQKFYVEKEIKNPSSPDFGKKFSIFDHNTFAVAYGAYVKVLGTGGVYHYCIATKEDGKDGERNAEMVNLLNQYTSWKARNYYEEKRLEDLATQNNDVPF